MSRWYARRCIRGGRSGNGVDNWASPSSGRGRRDRAQGGEPKDRVLSCLSKDELASYLEKSRARPRVKPVPLHRGTLRPGLPPPPLTSKPLSARIKRLAPDNYFEWPTGSEYYGTCSSPGIIPTARGLPRRLRSLSAPYIGSDKAASACRALRQTSCILRPARR